MSQEISLLDQAMAASGVGAGDDLKHKPDPEGADQLSLEALDKPIHPKAALYLASQKLLTPEAEQRLTGRRGQTPKPNFDVEGAKARMNEPYIPNEYGAAEKREMVQQYNYENQGSNVDDYKLKSQVEFYKNKLELCETYLPNDSRQRYEDDWLRRIVEAAGDDLVTSAGRGFLKMKDDEDAEKRTTEETEEKL